jgi:hypothetical protein
VTKFERFRVLSRHFVVTVLMFPVIVAGYLFGAVASALSAGRFIYERDEDEAIRKWVDEPKQRQQAQGGEK